METATPNKLKGLKAPIPVLRRMQFTACLRHWQRAA